MLKAQSTAMKNAQRAQNKDHAICLIGQTRIPQSAQVGTPDFKRVCAPLSISHCALTIELGIRHSALRIEHFGV
jgi:hypothetical protein